MGSNLKDWRSYGCGVLLLKDMEMEGLWCAEDLRGCNREEVMMVVPLKEYFWSKKEDLGLGEREDVRAVAMAAMDTKCLMWCGFDSWGSRA